MVATAADHMEEDEQRSSQPSSDSREEIEGGRGMSIGVVNEGLSLSDDQLHQISGTREEWCKALDTQNNLVQSKNSKDSTSEVTWSWRSDAGSLLRRTFEGFKGFYDWLIQDYTTVLIHKGPDGELGIKLEGGLDKPAVIGDPGIFVKSVLKHGPADGKLTPGDRIVSVDDVDISCVCRSFPAAVVREAGDSVKLCIKRATTRQQRVYESSSSSLPFSNEQLEEFEDAFCMFDRRGKGWIKNKDVLKALRSLGYNLSEAQLWVFMSELGIRAEKNISFHDFVKLINIVIEDQDTERDIRQAFSMFDEGNSGFVPCGELERALKRMPGAGAVKSRELCDILRNSDPQNTGKIKIKGFRRLLYPSFKQY